MKRLHSWSIDPGEAIRIQKKLAPMVDRNGELFSPRYIGGVDLSVNRAMNEAIAAVVVLDYPGLRIIEIEKAKGNLDLPYIPGLLSFREAPLILKACRKISVIPQLLIVDGQGIAHPRRMGLASHLGLFLDIPTTGCAKSPLCGRYDKPGDKPGDYSEMVDKEETIGIALRTRTGAKPIYISTGHMISIESAMYWILKCCTGYRLPQPTRLAHQAAGGTMKTETIMVE